MTAGSQQSGGQALKEHIERVNPGATGPEVRLLVGSVGFMVQREQPTGRYDVIAAGEIDRFGHISLRRTKPHMPTDLAEYEERVAARQADMAEALLEEGLAEYRQVGPGETELYAMQPLLRLVAPAIAALPRDWQRWSP